jgi:TonB-linked SusC/RagA family outer membrane protein
MGKKRCYHGLEPCYLKFLRKMKLTILVLLLSVFASWAKPGYSQTNLLSLEARNITLEDFLRKIEDQSEFRFFYSGRIDIEKSVSGVFENKSIKEVLDAVLKKVDIKYELKGRQIILSPSDSSVSSDQQQKSISGKVNDTSGTPLPGVSVIIAGTSNGTVTDANGNYSFSAIPVGATLQFSFVGMKPKEVKIASQNIINVVLEELSIGIDEVVAVAFGTQQKHTMTSSVSQVDSKALESRPVGNVASALQGQVAGINVTQSSGQPGTAASITIRGVGSLQSGTSPLIIIDGIPGTLSMVDPNDVESISVLKDAAACSLYGARAANGVILVTTKHGKLGKLSISYSGYAGYQDPTELFQEANAYNYANAYNLALMNDAITRTLPTFNEAKKVFTAAQLSDWQSGAVASTNWRKALFDQNGFTQSHSVNISGGLNQENVTIKNNASFGFLEQRGNVVHTNYKRYSIRDNAELKWNKFTTGVSLGLTYSDSGEPTSAAVGGLGSIISAVNRQRPVDPIKTDDGEWNITATNDTRNPVRQAYEGGISNTDRYNVLVNVNVGYEILKGLTAKLTNGINYTESTNNAFKNSLSWYNGTVTGPNSSTKTSYRDVHYLQQFDVNYRKSIGKHNFAAIVGGQQEYHTYTYLMASRKNFINNSSESLQLGSVDGLDNSSTDYDWGLMGVFGRINYDFNQKYLLEVNFREDGSSRLSPGKNWDFFPSVSAGWRVSEESFLDGLKSVVSELKLRGSYGVLGNQNLPGSDNNALYYSYKSIVGAANDPSYWGPLYYVFGGTLVNPMTIVQDPNTAFTWERTALTDLAAEGNLWKGLVNFRLGYFSKKTTGMLMTKKVSAVHGGNDYVANIGKMRNSGVEIELGVNKTTQSGLAISLNGNMSYMTNKILDLGGQDLAASGVYKNTVNYPLNAYYLYVNDGLLTKSEFLDASYTLLNGQKYGDQKIKDISGASGTPDGKINASDKVMTNKTSTPKWYYGLNFDVSYKNIGIAGILQGAAGYYKYLGGSVGYGFNSGYSITQWTIDNSYNPLTDENNYNTRLPRVSATNTINNTYPSNIFLFNCSYLRLKNLQVYYNLPSQILEKVNISRAKIYFSGQNLYTLSALPKALGVDPEIGSATADYPLVKVLSLGLDVTF